jgi:predicted AlkP superfamily pyrophosphatase or phosphodiesterase
VTRRGLLASLAALVLGAASPASAATDGGNDGRNAPQHQQKPAVVLVSIDGYRWDYPDHYPTPAIRRLVDGGMRAEHLEPVFPTLTFPNHYSLVTGLSPAAHGIVSNDFPDGDRWYTLRDREAVSDASYYLGEPLWVTAERQGVVTASFYWVGSEAPVQGMHPSHWRPFDGDVPNADRADQVVAWLGESPETRPRLITLYFEDVDNTSHRYGVGSPEFTVALNDIDQALGRLLDGIDALPHGDDIYVVLVSDHGHMPYHDDPPFVLEDHLYLDGLTLVDKGPAVYAWQDSPDAAAAAKLAETVNAAWPNGRAWTRDTAPTRWGLRDSDRMPDLVFQADAGYAVISRMERTRTVTAADHGWSPETKEMRGVFIARGPGIAPGTNCDPLRVTAVHPLILEWLALDAPPAVGQSE